MVVLLIWVILLMVLTALIMVAIKEIAGSTKRAKSKRQKKFDTEFDDLKNELKGKADARSEEVDLVILPDEKTEAHNVNKRNNRSDNHPNEAVDILFAEVQDSGYKNSLEESLAIIEKLEKESNVDKAEKIDRFFNRYIPLVTEIIVAEKTGESNASKAIELFNVITKQFYGSIYKTEIELDNEQV